MEAKASEQGSTTSKQETGIFQERLGSKKSIREDREHKMDQSDRESAPTTVLFVNLYRYHPPSRTNLIGRIEYAGCPNSFLKTQLVPFCIG